MHCLSRTFTEAPTKSTATLPEQNTSDKEGLIGSPFDAGRPDGIDARIFKRNPQGWRLACHDAWFLSYLRKRIRQDAVTKTPFRHTVWVEDGTGHTAP